MMKPRENLDPALLHDLRRECATILGRIENKTLPEFVSDPSLQDGIVLRLILIGEAVKKLSTNTKSKFPKLEWSQMARFRDLVVHHYSRVDALQLWEIIHEEVPALLAALTPQ